METELPKEQIIPDGFCKSRSGVIPKDWDCIKLGDAIEYKKGFAFKSENFIDNGVRVVRISDTTINSINDTKKVYITIEDANGLRSWSLCEGDLVISSVGSRPPLYDSMVGKVVKVPKHADGSLLNQNAIRIRSKDIIIQDLIFNYLKGKRYNYYIESIVRGNANQVSITLKDLFLYYIPLPPLEEQRKIVDILSTQDNIIELKERLIAEKEKQKKYLMQVLLNPENEHFIRIDGFDGDWKEHKLSNIGKCFNGLTGKTKDDFGIGVPYLAYKKIFDNPFSDYNEVDLVNISENENQNFLKNGDILFTVSSETAEEVAYTSVYIGNGKMYLNSFCFGYRLNNTDFLSPIFMGYYFRSDYFRRKVYRLAQGSTRYNISKNMLMKEAIVFPEIEEQVKIYEILNMISDEIKLLKNELQNHKLSKKALMQQLLTGKVRVSV